jgi:hypothetical protein
MMVTKNKGSIGSHLVSAFFLFFTLLAGVVNGIALDDSTMKKNPFNVDFFIKNFHLSLNTASEDPHIIKNSSKSVHYDSSSKKPGKHSKESQIHTKKRFTRALFTTLSFIILDSIRYWINAEWVEDWQYKLNWKDQKIRFFSLKANRFDSNPYITNWSHIIPGGFYYSFARYYRLNRLESVLFSTGCSLFWEYITEWREVISINDNLFSGFGGIILGEPLFQIGSYYNNRPGLFNKVLQTLFNPIITVNNLLGGKKKDPGYKPTASSKPYFEWYVGNKQVTYKGTENPISSVINIGFETHFNTISGYDTPGQTSGFVKDTMLSQVFFDLSLGSKGVEEFSVYIGSVLFGYFNQKLTQDSTLNKKGYSLFLGMGSGFDLFKKRSIAPYDKGEFHIDFASGVELQQPTEFTDKYAILNLFGPVFKITVKNLLFEFVFRANAYLDFALVNAIALNRYSVDHDLYQNRMKTTLSYYGYYYALGFTLSSNFDLSYKNFGIDGKLRYHYFDSLEGLDRFQYDLEDDCTIKDSRFLYQIGLSYSFLKIPAKLRFSIEGIKRWGTIKEFTHKEMETRIVSQIIFSF